MAYKPMMRAGAKYEGVQCLNVDEGTSSRSITMSNASSDGDRSDIVQFTAPIYFVEKTEGTLQVDVMRLGSMKGALTVKYSTEDGSARAGREYVAQAGELVMQDGESSASLAFHVIQDGVWAPTLEFKLVLSEASNCTLGLYLAVARVKVIDNELFPSSKYRANIEHGEDGVTGINGPGLFWEYFKLNLSREGIRWKTWLTIFMDQMQNIYVFWILYANIYMVDVLFDVNNPETEKQLWASTREETALFIAATYIVPMLFIHAWDFVKVRMDVRGSSRTFIQKSLFRKYLNYSEESRLSVQPSDMQLALIKDAADLADGYASVLTMMQVIGKVSVMAYFVKIYNQRALWNVFAMPCLMFTFAAARNGVLAAASAVACREESSLVGIVSETCTRYRLIADYFQRPHMNHVFAEKSEDLRSAHLKERTIIMNNDYITKWIGPVFIGQYIAANAAEVLNGEHSLGTFLTTISVFGYIACDFGDLYREFITVSSVIEPLRGFTTYFNLATDLKRWKSVNRRRREVTKLEREKVLDSADAASSEFRTDQIPLKVTEMSYSYPQSSHSLPSGDPNHGKVFKDVTVSCKQGGVVAVVGPHCSGKSTFLRLLGHNIFPEAGSIFLPTHLRILHVSQEPVLLKFSAFRNLVFGCPNPADWDPARITKILQALSMSSTLALVQKDLDKLERQRNSRPRSSSASAANGGAQKENFKAKRRERDEDCFEEELQSMLESEFDELVKDEEDEGHAVEHLHHDWYDELTYTEKVKMHLARALIMNPEVLILQRPLHHYEKMHGLHVLKVIKEHSKNRGLFLPAASVSRRRPRTVFFSPDLVEQAREADVIWQLDPRTRNLFQSDASKLTDGFEVQRAESDAVQ